MKLKRNDVININKFNKRLYIKKNVYNYLIFKL